MRPLGPTESARRSHASARSRQYCGDISAPIPGNLRTFSGSPNTPLAKSCPKLASAWGARLSGGDTLRLWGIVMILNAGSPTLRGPGSRSRRSAQLWELVDRDGHFRAIHSPADARRLRDRRSSGEGSRQGNGGRRCSSGLRAQSWLLRINVRYLTVGSGVGYIRKRWPRRC
jgi:hypothetical protein